MGGAYLHAVTVFSNISFPFYHLQCAPVLVHLHTECSYAGLPNRAMSLIVFFSMFEAPEGTFADIEFISIYLYRIC